MPLGGRNATILQCTSTKTEAPPGIVLFIVSSLSLHSTMGGWDAANHISVLSVCSLLGSAKRKGRRREQEFAPSYLSADFAIVTPMASKNNWFLFPVSFHTPKPVSARLSVVATPAGQRPPQRSVSYPGAFPPSA